MSSESSRHSGSTAASSSEAASQGSIRPSLRWMLRSPPRIFAFGFGSGLIRPAPGTWGTLMGWLIWVLLLAHLSNTGIAVVLAASFLYGCLICHRVGKDLGRPDHGGMVWDEMVAIWLVLWFAPDSFWAQLVAFGLFRLFDIVKPPPIRFFDGRLKNGFGVMWDDMLAALYSIAVLAILRAFGFFAAA